MTAEKKYFVVDLQDWNTEREFTLDDCKEFMKDYFVDDEDMSEEEYEEFCEKINGYNKDSIEELLNINEYIILDSREEYEAEKSLVLKKTYKGEIKMKRLTDNELKELWEELGDIPFDEDKDGEMIISEEWLHFEKGTDRETIWQWFDECHSKGVVHLMFGNL